MDEPGLSEGQLLGHYRIEQKLGEGGMGVVYRAVDTRLGRTVAIKLLRADALRDPERRRRFVLEAKAPSALNHPNIITIHAIEQAGGVDYIVMEFVTGRALTELIASGLTMAQILDFAVQISRALARAHGAGIIHRDIKPDNILVTDDGRVKVLDFGLAKLLEEPEARRAAAATVSPLADEGTQFGAIIGTLEYLSPEQASGNMADARSDVFSFGCVLYEMLTGIRPFASHSSASNDILEAIQIAEPARPSSVRADVSPGLEQLVLKTLRKQQDDRFQTMSEVLAALEREIDAIDRRGTRRGARKLYAAVALAVIAVALGIAWFWPRKVVRPPTSIIPVTTYPGAETEPAISPDGQKVAFLWDGDNGDQLDIYVKPVSGGGDPVRLTNDRGSKGSIAWMPDGNSVIFVRRIKGQGFGVFEESASGGPERRITATVGAVDVSPDGRSLAIVEGDEQNGRKIDLLDLASGQRRVIAVTPAGFDADRRLRFSPDGRSLAFIRERTGSNEPGICVLSLATGTIRQILSSSRGMSGIAWTNDSKEILYSWEPLGRQPSLYRIPVKGGVPDPVLNNAYAPSVARHARRLAFTQNFYQSNIYRLPLPRMRGGVPAGPITAQPQKLIPSTLLNDSPEYSPDGSRIAFVSNREGDMDIWVADADGRHPVQLTHMAGTGSPRWSPDGKWIAFDAHPKGNTDIFKISANGGVPIRLTDSPGLDVLPAWSPDGRSLFFASNRSGEIQLWKVPANGGAAVQVTNGGGWESRLSPDGRTLFYSKTPAHGLWQVPAGGGPEARVPGASDLGEGRNWTVVPGGVYFIESRHNEPGATLKFFSFATQRTTALYHTDAIVQPGKPNLSVSPDGKWVLFSQMDMLTYDIAVLDNFE